MPTKNTFQARAGDIVSITGKLKYSVVPGRDCPMWFLVAEDGKEFNVADVPDCAAKIVKTCFVEGDIVQLRRENTSGKVMSVSETPSGTVCFVKWATGYAFAYDDAELRHYVEPVDNGQLDAFPPPEPNLTAAQVAEIEAEAEAAQIPDLNDVIAEAMEEAPLTGFGHALDAPDSTVKRDADQF